MLMFLTRGETEVPAGISTLFEKGKRFQDICMKEMTEGRTGNEILKGCSYQRQG